MGEATIVICLIKVPRNDFNSILKTFK